MRKIGVIIFSSLYIYSNGHKSDAIISDVSKLNRRETIDDSYLKIGKRSGFVFFERTNNKSFEMVRDTIFENFCLSSCKLLFISKLHNT